MSILVVYSCNLSIFGPVLIWISIFFNEINFISKVGLNYLQNLIYSSTSGEMWILPENFGPQIKVAKIVNKIYDSVLDNVIQLVQKKTRHKSLNYLNSKIFRCKIRKFGFKK